MYKLILIFSLVLNCLGTTLAERHNIRAHNSPAPRFSMPLAFYDRLLLIDRNTPADLCGGPPWGHGLFALQRPLAPGNWDSVLIAPSVCDVETEVGQAFLANTLAPQGVDNPSDPPWHDETCMPAISNLFDEETEIGEQVAITGEPFLLLLDDGGCSPPATIVRWIDSTAAAPTNEITQVYPTGVPWGGCVDSGTWPYLILTGLIEAPAGGPWRTVTIQSPVTDQELPCITWGIKGLNPQWPSQILNFVATDVMTNQELPSPRQDYYCAPEGLVTIPTEGITVHALTELLVVEMIHADTASDGIQCGGPWGPDPPENPTVGWTLTWRK